MALVKKTKISDSDHEKTWSCHCCTFKNSFIDKKCKVCGRPESYVQLGYPLPFHGKNSNIYRPSQMLTVLEDIHLTDSENWTSLHSACADGNYDIAKSLIEYKSPIDAVTNKGQTPLHLAVYVGSYECVELLIKNKANVNASTYYEKNTPLHLSCKRGFAKITQLLIQNGADINAVDLVDRTPLHCAAISGRDDIGMILINCGAKVDVLDKHGWDPRQVAELFGHDEFQNLLIRETMNEKQAVIKEKPKAKWHSDIWDSIIETQAKKKMEYQNLQNKIKEEEERLDYIRSKRIIEAKEKIRQERQLELRKYLAYQTK